MSILTQR